MRATVTISDEIFERIDEIARAEGKSRSAVYQLALESYLAKVDSEALTEQLNEHLEKNGLALDDSYAEHIQRNWSATMGDDSW